MLSATVPRLQVILPLSTNGNRSIGRDTEYKPHQVQWFTVPSLGIQV